MACHDVDLEYLLKPSKFKFGQNNNVLAVALQFLIVVLDEVLLEPLQCHPFGL